MAINVVVHLYFLFRSVCRNCKKKAKLKKLEKQRGKQINMKDLTVA